MVTIRQSEVHRVSRSRGWVPTRVKEIELGDYYQFWLAYVARACASDPHLWYSPVEPWSILLQKDLLYISDTLPGGEGDGRGALHRFTVTGKGQILLDSLDPAVIVDNAIRRGLWTMAADWMADLPPKHLPAYLSHGSYVVRKMALARAGFLEQHGWPDKKE